MPDKLWCKFADAAFGAITPKETVAEQKSAMLESCEAQGAEI